MSIGERIRYLRLKRGMTQQYLGEKAGFEPGTAAIRMAQYESGKRSPKEEITRNLADALDVSPLALNVPETDTDLGLMHTLFALEDMLGFEIRREQCGGSILIDFRATERVKNLSRDLDAWIDAAEQYRSGKISKTTYDQWRYKYPEYAENSPYHKVLSRETSDILLSKFSDLVKPD